MTAYDIVFLASLLTAGLFVGVGIYSAKEVLSPLHFFHNAKESSNIVSLSVANVTLGTGLVYLVTGAHQHGAAMLLVPVATLLGYLLLARTAEGIARYNSDTEQTNLLAAVQHELDRLNPSDRIPVASSVTVCLAVVYSLALGYELVASPKILAPFAAQTPGLAAEVYFALLLFVAALLTVLFGGIKGVFRTDWLQLGAIVTVLFMMLWVATDQGQLIGRKVGNADSPTGDTWASLTAVLMACVAAIATQYYSLLNWATASHVQARRRASVFRRVGLLTAFLLVLMVISGLATSGHEQGLTGALAAAYSKVALAGDFSMWIVGVLVAVGLTSIVCSTADSLVLTITQFAYDNVVNGNSRDASRNPKLLTRIRLIMGAAFAAGFAAMATMFYGRQDLFNTLLMIATGVVVFAPFIWLLAVLLKEPDGLSVIRRWVLWSYVGMFVATYAVALYLLFTRPQGVAALGIFALAVSLVFTLGLFRASKRQLASLKAVERSK